MSIRRVFAVFLAVGSFSARHLVERDTWLNETLAFPDCERSERRRTNRLLSVTWATVKRRKLCSVGWVCSRMEPATNSVHVWRSVLWHSMRISEVAKHYSKVWLSLRLAQFLYFPSFAREGSFRGLGISQSFLQSAASPHLRVIFESIFHSREGKLSTKQSNVGQQAYSKLNKL
jgi:hypothetical protein